MKNVPSCAGIQRTIGGGEGRDNLHPADPRLQRMGPEGAPLHDKQGLDAFIQETRESRPKCKVDRVGSISTIQSFFRNSARHSGSLDRRGDGQIEDVWTRHVQ